MLRDITGVLAISVLAAACALVEPPPPAGTLMIEAQIRSTYTGPVELSVMTPTGELPEAIRPAMLAPMSTTTVTLHVPVASTWDLALNGSPFFSKADFEGQLHPGCKLMVQFNRDGGGSLGCLAQSPDASG